jgi:hypothetical protein
MIAKQFQFYDHTEQFYSYASQERFYAVLKQHPQLEKILLNKHGLDLLQRESKEFKKMMYLGMGGSVLTLYPFNRLLSFGPGALPLALKAACNLAILLLPTFYIHDQMR